MEEAVAVEEKACSGRNLTRVNSRGEDRAGRGGQKYLRLKMSLIRLSKNEREENKEKRKRAGFVLVIHGFEGWRIPIQLVYDLPHSFFLSFGVP